MVIQGYKTWDSYKTCKTNLFMGSKNPIILKLIYIGSESHVKQWIYVYLEGEY